MYKRQGISTAAVPVLDKNPDMTPTITMIAMINVLSVLANLVTRPPILFAIPVSNSAWPTTNMPTQRITLLFTYCENVVDTSTTPVSVNPDRKSTRLNSSHSGESRMPSSA